MNKLSQQQRNKRFSLALLALLCLAVIGSFYLRSSRAAGVTSWDGPVSTAWQSGDGPYYISTSADLAGLAMIVNSGDSGSNFSGKTIYLSNDIDLESKDWVPIGLDYSKHFSGTFRGQGHTVQNLYISDDQRVYIGLFGYIYDSASISDLAVTGSVKSSYSNNYSYAGVGGIAGYLSYSTIDNCVSIVSAATSGGNSYVGGIAGDAYHARLNNCVNIGSITSNGSGVKAGGVAGYVSRSTLNNCVNAASGVVSGSGKLGGITGHVFCSDLINCVNAASVIPGDGSTAGGIAAKCETANTGGIGNMNSNIQNCAWYASDSVNSNLEAVAESINGGVGSISIFAKSVDNYEDVVAAYTVDPENTTIAKGKSAVVMRTWPGTSADAVSSDTPSVAPASGLTVAKDANNCVKATAAVNGIYFVSANVTFTPTNFGIAGATSPTAYSTLLAANVNVVEHIPATGIAISPNSDTTVKTGETAPFEASISPKNSDSSPVWTISADSGVISADSSDQTCTVKGLKAGAAELLASADGHLASVKITVTQDVTEISLDKTATVAAGSSKALYCTVLPSDATNKAVTWTSSAPTIASVDTNGKITALKAGTATITATAADGSGKAASCTVTVTQKVTGVSLNQTALALKVNGTEKLTATVSPSDATSKDVTWSTSNAAVATVDTSGNVTAKGNGTATITVKTTDGSKTATCAVTVTTSVTGVTLDKSTLALKTGGTAVKLTATVAPATATSKDVTWSSSNTAVATVDTNGNVTAKGNGTATITVKTTDGSKTATCAVTVTTSVTGVTLDKSTLALKTDGAAVKLTATIAPTTATSKDVTWSSSNTAVAAVDTNGNVTAKANGTATITVTTVDGSKTATCAVTVTTSVTGVTLDKSTLALKTGGAAVKLTATIAPTTATSKDVTWSSSNAAVAAVDTNGNVTAKGNGTATITVKTTDGSKTAVCAVTVTTSVTGVTLDKSTLALKTGGAAVKLTATVAPATATSKDVTWSSSNTAVATVDTNGNVTAKGNGTATITVKTTDGSKTATCAVTVTTSVTGVTLDKSTLALKTDGAAVKLTATVAPTTATSKDVTWSTSNAAVATVDTSGNVTAKANGSATITVTTVDGSKTDTCAVTVTTSVTGVTLDKSTLALKTGGAAVKLTATIAPTTATSKDVTWSSSNAAVAAVDTNGNVTAKANGTATITVKTTDGSKTATCAVTVTTDVMTITLSKTATTIEAGASETLTATVKPDDAANKTVNWTTSNASVATVSGSGRITAVKVGTATITATAADGSGKSASCTVTVPQKATGVTLSPTVASVAVGSSVTIKATVAPTGATDPSLTWTSSNSSVATVANGVVKGVAAGTATITAATNDGSKLSAYSLVTVYKAADGTGYGDIASVVTPVTSQVTLPSGSAATSAAAKYLTVADITGAAKDMGLGLGDLAVDSGGNLILGQDIVTKALASTAASDPAVKSGDVQVLPIVSATVAKGGLAALTFEVSGDRFGAVKTAADMKVMKILADGRGIMFDTALSSTGFADKHAALFADDGSTLVTGSVDKTATYKLTVFIQDNGEFDLCSGDSEGKVIDPVAVVKVASEDSAASGDVTSGDTSGDKTSRHHGSGCNDGFPALLALMAIPFAVRRKKK